MEKKLARLQCLASRRRARADAAWCARSPVYAGPC